jgi:hypothetical protein
VAMGRMVALFAESAEALTGLATRFAVNFALRAPELVLSPAGGAATGVGIALATGVRDPGDLAASGLLGAAESGFGPRRRGIPEANATEEGATPPMSRLPTVQDRASRLGGHPCRRRGRPSRRGSTRLRHSMEPQLSMLRSRTS